MEYGYADLQERIERQSEFLYGLVFTKTSYLGSIPNIMRPIR